MVIHSVGILEIEAGTAALMIKMINELNTFETPSGIMYEYSAVLAPLFFGMLIAGAVFSPLPDTFKNLQTSDTYRFLNYQFVLGMVIE
jgi:hypothetical protein